MKRIIGRALRLICNFPSTCYINFRTLPFYQARSFPIVIMSKCKMIGLKKGSIIIKGKTTFGMIKIGAISSSIVGLPTNPRTTITAKDDGKYIFEGNAGFGKGSALISKGELVFGNNFDCNINCFISADTKMMFGQDVQLGWNVHIRDSDGHTIFDNDGIVQNSIKPVVIGEHCWIAANASILKGVTLHKNTIVGWGSVVVKSTSEENTVVAGNPAKQVKKDINWRP